MILTHNVSPKKLLQNLLVIVLLSSILIVSVSVTGFYWVYEQHVISDTERDAVSISEAILAAHKKLLLEKDHTGTEHLVVEREKIAQLETNLKLFLAPHNIIKIKLFDHNGTIIYSTDKSIIGENDKNNQRLKNALQGVNDSKLQIKHQIKDLIAERRFDVDVVESYVPIYNNRHEIIGSFEIYKDVSRLRREIKSGVGLSFLVLISIIGITFAISCALVRRGAKELSNAQQKLHQLATKDALTGLYSRNEVIIHLKAELARYKRHFKSSVHFDLGILILDIDHFKSINDNFGHPVGDQVLVRVADSLVANTRDYGSIGRFGGEEFLVILPDANLQNCEIIAERIRTAIAELKIIVNENVVKVTTSIGISIAHEADDDYQQIIKRADDALYRAKNTGRNKVEVN